MVNSRAIFLIAIVVSAILARLFPHAPNLAPITAVALFGGAYLPDRRLALVVPLAAMLFSDVVLGFDLPGVTMAVYASFALVILLGFWVRQNRSPLRIGSAAVAGSLLFFVLTNFAVWAFGTIYPHTTAGLVQCYVAALPFFRNTLAGDLSYTVLLFGGFALLQRRFPMLREDAAVAA